MFVMTVINWILLEMTKMKFLLILACLTIVRAGVIKEEEEKKDINENTCTGIVLDGVYFDKEVIIEDLDRPYMLAVDNSSNILYFSYSVKKNEDVFRSAKIDLDNNKFADLQIVNGFAQTVDQKTRDVYIGSDDGIYKYNHKNNDAEFFGRRGSDIWSIYFKDELYFSEFPSQFLYTLINDTVVRFHDLEDTKVDHFIIDNDNNMFYTNATGLYAQKKGTKNSVLYEEFPSYGPRGITIDGMGEVYLCLRDGIYKVDKAETSLRKSAEVDDCFGIAFDRDNNVIYANSNSIVKLKPSDKKC